jgi:3-dehydroquinate synthase
VIAVPAGERSKSLKMLDQIYTTALRAGIDRGTPVLALGGGVVGDLAGYAAATLLRGVPFVQLPTTLIAQVDSSVGGKTGINHAAGKNLIGSFYPPRLVVADPETLLTLSDRDWASGMAEIIKHAAISDMELATFLVQHWDALFDRQMDVVTETLRRAVQVKIDVVADDEFERGRRAFLNFGHTVGHALELLAGYGTLTHGEAVAIGMRFALRLSRARYPTADFSEIADLLRRLPDRLPLDEFPARQIVEAMRHDKKRRDGDLHFVLLEAPARPVLAAVSEAEVVQHWNTFQDERM